MSLSDVENRILNSLDEIRDSLKDLCNRMTKVESSLDNHYQEIQTEDKLKREDERRIQLKKEWKEKKFYIAISIISTAIAIYTVISGIL